MEEKKQEKSHLPARLNILFFIVFLFFAMIILRLAYVQLVEGEQYKHDLEKYSTRELSIPAPRGRILDVNGEVLVSNKPVYTVTYVEEEGKDIDTEKVADKLASILKIEEDKIGTDEELLQKAVELQATLPVSFDREKTQWLISQIRARMEQLPPVSAVDTLSDPELVKAGLLVGLRLPLKLEEEQRQALLQQLSSRTDPDQFLAIEQASDFVLLKQANQLALPLPVTLTEKERNSLVKDVKYKLNILPASEELGEKSDMDLLRYASQFEIPVDLPLTDEQRRYQWHRLGILEEMRALGVPRYMPRRVRVNISEEEMSMIEERRKELPGVDVIVEPIRNIRDDGDGGFGTHFLGYTNAISPERLEEYRALGYNQMDRIGELGLELYYERQLRGKNGIMAVQVNKDAETIEKRMVRPAEPGNDLVLAMDWRFQSKVEQILKEKVTEFKQSGVVSDKLNDAHAIVMNPNTGEILAFSTYPDYDLNLHYADRKTFNEKYATEILPNQLNRLIGSAYAPGSTVKMLYVMLALQEGLVTPNEKIIDRGGLQIGNIFFRNWRPGGHGPVDARTTLKVSNNTYMYTMAVRLAQKAQNQNKSYKTQFEVLDYYNAQFGLGVKTGVDLPNEINGWSSPHTQLGNLAHAFIGQYDNFTPLQLAQYVSTIANGGYRMRPYFVKEIREGTVDPNQPGRVLSVTEPEVLNRVAIDEQWIKLAQEGMRMVTQPGGTGYRFFEGLPFTVAAKTGTAETGDKSAEHSLIVGYAPYENPQIAFVVIVPYSGWRTVDTSGPIAREILLAYHELYPLTGTTSEN